MSQPFREPLEQLHKDLEEANASGEHALLRGLQRDTRTTLDAADHREALSAQPSFRSRLEEAVERFGASHPKLTETMMHVLHVLNSNGI